MPTRQRDLTGVRSGRLLVLGPTPNRKYYWRCQCDCGRMTDVIATRLAGPNRKTLSCRCLRVEIHVARLFKHGEAAKHTTKEYTTWMRMKARCTCPTKADYENYGGRGI